MIRALERASTTFAVLMFIWHALTALRSAPQEEEDHAE